MDHHGVHSIVTVAGDAPLLNGEALSKSKFEELLALASRTNPVVHILYDPSGARDCEKAKRIRDHVNRLADSQGDGLCGQGAASEFLRLRDTGAAWRVKNRSIVRER